MKTVGNFLNEIGLMNQVLNGIERLGFGSAFNELCKHSINQWSMGLIKKSVDVAGQCVYAERKILLNKMILENGREPDRNNTFLHELGHMFHCIYKELKTSKFCYSRRGVHSAHGYFWKKITQSIGGTGTRCHDYPYFKDARKKNAKHLYKCKDCGIEIYTMKKLVRMNTRFHGPCKFKENQGRLSHTNLMNIKQSVMVLNPEPVNVTKKSISGDTKKCTKCESKGRESIHPVSDFPKNKSQKDGLSGWCKQCHIDYRNNRK